MQSVEKDLSSSPVSQASNNSGVKEIQAEVTDQLLRLPSGEHYLILYSNMEAMRKVYSNYIKKQMEEEPDAVVLFLTYYDTTDRIRDILSTRGIAVKEYEKKGSIIILDIMKVIRHPFYKVPDIERLRELARKIENQFKDRTIFIMADMSVFNHLNKSSELLEYERTLHENLKIERWKELCLYNKLDLEKMFIEDKRANLIEYHKGKIIFVN
jgi:hypothetical protein